MSTNGLTATTDAQADTPLQANAPLATPKGYTKWFNVEFKNIIFDPTILHRKEAIEAYYIGYLTGYNIIKSKKYAILFEWTEVASKLPNCKDFTLHVYITPPPTIIRKAKVMAASLNAPEDVLDEDVIDPPTPPKPPPPTM